MVQEAPKSATRRVALPALAVLAASFSLVLLVSRVTGPTFDELGRIGADARARELVRAFSDFGLTASVSSSARSIYDELASFGVLPASISGSFGDALSHAGIVDKLTGVRFGWLLVTALAPLSLFLVVEASAGLRIGLLAASMLVAIPRWTHAAGVGSEGAVVTSLWLLVVAVYVRSLPPPLVARRSGASTHYRSNAAIFGIVFGVALATSVATLWVVPFIVLHYFVLRGRDTLRMVRRGGAPLPSAFLWALPLSPIVVLALTPKLWHGGAVSAAEWLLLQLAPTVEAVQYKGAAVTVDDVPSGYAAGFFVATVPVLVLLLALAGVVFLALDARRARRREREPDAVGLSALVLIGVVAALVGPALEPRVFIRFPPRTEAALPWVAAACAVGVDRLAVLVAGRAAKWIVPLAAAASGALGLVRISTAGASFGLLVGGTRGAIAGKRWTVGDGSEVSVVARAIDALRLPRVSLRAPDVPRNYFTVLSSVGRLVTRVDVGATGDLVLVRGPRNGALATADQAGATLWSLTRRR